MHITSRQEQYGTAFVRALGAVCGLSVATPVPDHESVDLVFAARRADGYRRSPRLEVQLKCTANAHWSNDGERLAFDLPIKNHEELSDPDRATPIILVVLLVPSVSDSRTWIAESVEHTCLRQAAYWCSLRGNEPATNTTTQRIHIPRHQQFTTNALQRIMGKLGNEGGPL